MRTIRSMKLLALAALLTACGGAARDAGAPSTESATGMAAPAMAAADAPVSATDDVEERDSAAKTMEAEAYSKKGPDKAPPPKAPAGQPGGPSPEQAPTRSEGGGEAGRVTDDRRSPILIYKADFTMSVYEVQKAIDAVETLARKSGGYLARRDDRSITIRVPAGEFQAAVAELAKLGDVLSRNVSAEDVTAEYRDLEVQLANALALRDRYAKLLEKAQKVEEALAIEQELGRITGEIERIKGRLKLLGELAQFSTVTVHFSPRVDQAVQEGPFVLPLPWLNNLGLPRLLQLR